MINFYNLIIILLVILCLQLAIRAKFINSNNETNDDYPKAFSKNNRVISFLLSYDNNHIDPIIVIFNEYKTICEAGWNVTIIMFTTVIYNEDSINFFNQKLFCYRINSPITLKFSVHDKSIGIYLRLL